MIRAVLRGDRVVFYADGIIEASDNAKNMLGVTGLKKIVINHKKTPQSKLADEIIIILGI